MGNKKNDSGSLSKVKKARSYDFKYDFKKTGLKVGLIETGTITMSAEDFDAFFGDMKEWCSCEEEYGVSFVEDGVSEICNKHHYTCNKCGKIRQIG